MNLKTSMSDMVSFVFFFLSGSFIRSDRKSLIIKQEWGGQAIVADDRGACLCVIESHLRRLKIAKEQDA